MQEEAQESQAKLELVEDVLAKSSAQGLWKQALGPNYSSIVPNL
jgi:hypothetical protein